MSGLAYESLEDVEFPDDIHTTSTGISNEKLGMWVYLASDCLLFGGMISTYLIYKNRPGEIAGLTGNTDKVSEYFDLEETLTAGVYIKTCSWLLDHARLR